MNDIHGERQACPPTGFLVLSSHNPFTSSRNILIILSTLNRLRLTPVFFIRGPDYA
jgi:hypothetical protein